MSVKDDIYHPKSGALDGNRASSMKRATLGRSFACWALTYFALNFGESQQDFNA